MLELLKRRLGRDSIAFQTVLKRIPFSPKVLWKLFANGVSVHRSGLISAKPVALNLESTAKCNLKCAMCPRTSFMTRDVGNMELDFYRRIVDDIDPVFVTLAQFGEPFLHPGLEEMVAHAAAGGRMVRITTNATAFKPKRLQELMRAGVGHFMVSFDSCRKETYERIRVGARFEHVVDNIKTLIDLARPLGDRSPIISFNVTLTRDNVAELCEMMLFCEREFGIQPSFTKSYNYGEAALVQTAIRGWAPAHRAVVEGIGLARQRGWREVLNNLITLYNDLETPIRGYRPCFWPYFSTNVSWDGRVFPCCNYFDCQTDLGNLRTTPFKELWNGRLYGDFRRGLKENRDGFAICRACELVDVGINNAICGVQRLVPPARLWAGRRFVPIHRSRSGPPAT
ncbi:MAG: radical SAM protein [Magnetococcales bacterium]|nr:radical SAM protein [Magnetococcales bacterium]